MQDPQFSHATTQANDFRFTLRTGVAAVLAMVGACGVSCQGPYCNTPTSPAGLSASLAPVYILSNINGASLPTIYADSGSFRLRVYNDSLFLFPDNVRYTEGGRVGRITTADSSEAVRAYSLGDTLTFTSFGAGIYQFPTFLGGSASATAVPSYGHAILELKTAGNNWVFSPADGG